MNNHKQIPEAHHEYNKYYSCPHCHDAIYHTYSFTHRRFECKDCGQAFLVPEGIKLNKPKQFKRQKKEVKNG